MFIIYIAQYFGTYGNLDFLGMIKSHEHRAYSNVCTSVLMPVLVNGVKATMSILLLGLATGVSGHAAVSFTCGLDVTRGLPALSIKM